MLQNSIFSHTGISGTDATQRAADLGFAFEVSENIARQATSEPPNYRRMLRGNHNALFRSPGHRVNLMNPDLTLAGIGVRPGLWKSLNAQMITQAFSEGGDSPDSGPFIVGVAYRDLNLNGAYDPGEGSAGVEVRPDSGSYYAVTSTSGGYAIPMVCVTTNTEDVPLAFAVAGKTFDDLRPIDEQFRASRIAASPTNEVRLRWTGGPLTGPIETPISVQQPVRVDYRLMGSDGMFFARSMATAPSVRADLRLDREANLAPRLAQDLSFAAPRPVAYAPGRAVSLSASASSRLPVAFVSTNSLIEVSGSTAVVHGAGEFEITASQEGDSVYQPAAPRKRILRVARAKQVITFRLPEKVSLQEASLSLQAQAGSRLPVVFQSDRPELLSTDGGAVANLHALGVVTITARQEGNANYLPAKPVKRQVRIIP